VLSSPVTIPTDIWTAATWREYLAAIADPSCDKAKGYYYRGHMRIEISPIGYDHAENHSVVLLAINLFCICNKIPIKIADNCTYRKTGIQECQPDLSCHIGENARAIPAGTNIVDLDQYPAPNLVIEVAKTSLMDDLGVKRSLYEVLGVDEYWVVDVQNAQVLAYQIGDRGSKRIDTSSILPGLEILLIEEVLRRSRETDQSQVGAWLMAQFQQQEI
jgi:Uma2 family endonuclease